LTPDELDLSFPSPNDRAKFHQIVFKIATAGAMTDRHTDRDRDASDLIICPMLCYINGTDNKSVTLMTVITNRSGPQSVSP